MSEQTPDYDEVTAEQSVQDADLEAAQRFDGEDDGDGGDPVEAEVYGEADDATTEEPAEEEPVDPLEEFKENLRGKYGVSVVAFRRNGDGHWDIADQDVTLYADDEMLIAGSPRNVEDFSALDKDD